LQKEIPFMCFFLDFGNESRLDMSGVLVVHSPKSLNISTIPGLVLRLKSRIIVTELSLRRHHLFKGLVASQLDHNITPIPIRVHFPKAFIDCHEINAILQLDVVIVYFVTGLLS